MSLPAPQTMTAEVPLAVVLASVGAGCAVGAVVSADVMETDDELFVRSGSVVVELTEADSV